VFMVLRKKTDQVTALHVYHHALLLWSWYFVINVAPGGDAYFAALVNSIAHVFLYAYYMMSILNLDFPLKSTLWVVQLAQFVIAGAHAVYCHSVQSYPKSLLYLDMFVQLNMLFLFTNFFCANRHRSTTDHRRTASSSSSSSSRSDSKKAISMAEVRRHRTPEDCWCAIHGQVLDITDFLAKHPGGDVITLAAGREATVLAETYHPNGIPKSVIDRYRIGRVSDGSVGSYYAWNSPFYKTLRRRVVTKLRSLGRPRRGGREIWIKAVGLLLAFVACTWLMCTLEFGLAAVAAAAALGVVSAKIGTCIQHDGNHGAFAVSSTLNRWAGCTSGSSSCLSLSLSLFRPHATHSFVLYLSLPF